MFEKIKTYWEDLDVTVKVNKRELMLGVAVCTLAGLVTGMLMSPRKTVTVGSNNGNGNCLPPETDCEDGEDDE